MLITLEGLAEAQRRDAEAVEERAERVVAEGVGVPLGHDDDGLSGLAGLALGRRGKPARVDEIVFRVGRADGRGEAQEFGRGELSVAGLLLELGVFCEGLRADVGGEELGVAGLEAVVRGRGVVEEGWHAKHGLVEGEHGGFFGGGVAGGGGSLGGDSGGFEEVGEPVKAPFKMT